jgi:hypothetical protein
LSPVLAAAVMAMSSVSVVTNGLLLGPAARGCYYVQDDSSEDRRRLRRGARRYSLCSYRPFGAPLNIPSVTSGQTRLSVQEPLVEHVDENLPRQEAAEVLAEEVRLGGIYELWHDVRGVGAYDDVLHLP